MRTRILLSLLFVAGCLRGLGAADGEVIFSAFDSPDEPQIWDGGDSGKVKISVENRERTDRNKSLKVETMEGPPAGGDSYPGISTYKMPKDWSGYEVVSFEVWSSSKYGLGIRIDDANSKNYATRYNGGATIEAGHNLIQIPIADLKKSIDPSKIKALILFTNNSPRGFTLYFDNMRLGPRLSDKVEFIPYENRIELVPTIDVVSPHFPLCTPTAGGPLKVLSIYGMEEGRDLTELMERIDLKVSPVAWGKDSGIHKWIGLKYGERSYELSQRYLASSAQGPEHFDTMILGTPTGWIPLGKGGTDAILDRVKNKGEGLVLCFPFPGESTRHPWPDELKEISALVDSETDFMKNGEWMHRADNGNIAGQKWKIVKDHPITQGLQAALDCLPYEALEVQEYKVADGAEVLIETADGHPVVAVKQVGKGRVVTIAVRSDSLAPLVKNPGNRRQWRDYRYWEAFYDILARSAMWSAGREMKRDGDPVVLANPKFPDPNLSLKQWKNAKGEVTAWELGFTPPNFAKVTVTSPEFIKKGENIDVRFELPADLPADAQVKLRLVDFTGDRRRTMIEQTLPVKDGGATIATATLDQLAIFVEVEVVKDGKRLAFGQSTTYVTPSTDWTEYEVYGWPAGGISYLRDLQMERLREFGLTTEQVGPEGARESFQRGFRIQTMMGNSGMHANDFDAMYRQFSISGDKKLLIRNPSFADPAFLARQKADKQAWMKSLIPFSPLTVSVGDETSLSSYTAVFDFDFQPNNIANFRQAMKAKFGTIEALNAALGEAQKDFDSIEPPITTDAKKAGKFGLWNEWREHNDNMWTGAFQFYADTLKEVYPAARLSVSGTQTSAPFNGIDWAKLSLPLGATADYGGRYQICKRLSFNPNIRSTPWCGYGSSGRGAQYQLWYNLSFDGDGAAFFWYPSLLNPDFDFSESAQSYNVALKVIKAGVGKQYLQTHRQFSPVAVLWSVRSQRESWLQDKEPEFDKAEKQVYEGLIAAGYDPVWISEAQVAAGELKKRGIQALAMPMSLSIGFGGKAGGLDVLGAIKALIADGGVVLYTHPVAFNEFLEPATLPKELADKFISWPADADGLQKALEGGKVMPYANVRTADGARSKGTSTSLHRLVDAKLGPMPGYILTVLRTPVGQKEAIGADGVVYMEKDPTGGPPIETITIEPLVGKGMHFYDMRTHKEVQLKDGKFTIDMQDGDGRPFAILPAGPVTLGAAVKRTADTLTVSLALKADTKIVMLPHVVRMDVKDLSTGLVDGLMSKNLLVANPDGALTVAYPLALEDANRKFEITFTDVLTGSTQIVTP